jgi:hypothetical protein
MQIKPSSTLWLDQLLIVAVFAKFDDTVLKNDRRTATNGFV